jgi:tetratricopeptide (TPR) repeat protein
MKSEMMNSLKIRLGTDAKAVFIACCLNNALSFHRTSLSFVLFVIGLSLVNGQNDRKYIRQGNGKYSDEKYQESEILYRKALEADNMSGNATFNLGDALYRQNRYDEAGKQFADNAQKSKDELKKADSYYNLGNSLLKGKKLKESIDAYKNSLRFNPENAQAKYNLAYAQDLLKMQEQQQQQQDQGNNKQEDKDQDSKDQQQSNDQDKQDQQKPKENQSQQQQQHKISKEDAQRLLDALANDEKQVQEKVKEAKAAKARVKTLRNW